MTDPIHDVVIVGAGISGIGLAAHLTRAFPAKDVVLLERRENLGGTWDLFRYPGVRSDSDMFTLGYAFEPWRDDQAIAPGGRIRDYLHQVAGDYGVKERIRFGHRLLAADWDSGAGVWRLTVGTADGEQAMTARFLYLATGYYDYDDPYDAQIPGLDTFAGTVAHPQFWPADLDWSGSQVVVIGSGATAVTIVPAMAETAASVTMLQRTPSWYIARPSRDGFAKVLRRVLPDAWAHHLIRARNTLLQGFFFRRARTAPDKVGDYLKGEARDLLGPAWNEADFTPPYGPWQQRLCFVPDGDLFAALRDGRAAMATGRIAQVEAEGVRLEDGTLLPADVIVTATGLNLAIAGHAKLSLDGAPVNLAERWFYRDCMFSNLPNCAAFIGYLNAGWTLRVDVVAGWLVRLLKQMDAWGATVATPVLTDESKLVATQPLDLFSSGYLQRGKHLIPKSATAWPWRIEMDHAADKRAMALAPIDDGWMRFERAPALARTDAAA